MCRQASQNGVVDAFGGVVVQDDEIADVLDSVADRAIVLVGSPRVDVAASGKAGSAAGWPPGSGGCWSTRAARGSRSPGRSRRTFLFQTACAAPVVKRSGRGSASAGRRGWPAACARGLVVAECGAGVHVAVAGAMLQRDAPLPAGARARSSACRASAPSARSHGTATARSQGSQCVQSS